MKSKSETEELCGDEYLSPKEVAARLGTSCCGLGKLQKKDDFPKPVMMKSKKKWKRKDIESYIEGTRK